MNRSTITRQITTTEENIRRLMDDLEGSNSGTDELAQCQDNVGHLFGKLTDNNTALTSDVKEMLNDLRAGNISPDQLEKMLLSEREKVSYSLQLADNAKKNLEEVMSFVQHFGHDVERGLPVPKESFTSLYHELDTIADSVNSMSKVHRSKDIEKLKRIMQSHFEDKVATGVDGGVVSLKHILTENNREAKERQQRKAASQAGHNRTSIVSIGSLSRPRSSQGQVDHSSVHRLASPDMNHLAPPRVGSPSPFSRSGTAGSMGPVSPVSMGKSIGFDKTGLSMASLTMSPMEEEMSLHGRQSVIKHTKKAKKQGKREKRVSSAVIYAHTEDSDAHSVGSGDEMSLGGQGPPLALADFVPQNGKKRLAVHQGCQTDDYIIDSAQSRRHEVEGEEEGNPSAQDIGKGKKPAVKRKSGEARKGGGDGKAISMVSARRGSRDNSAHKEKKKDRSREKGGASELQPNLSEASSMEIAEGMGSDTKESGDGNVEESTRLRSEAGLEASSSLSDKNTQEYFKNYVDGSDPSGQSSARRSARGERGGECAEEGNLSDMSVEEARQFLQRKEDRLMVLEAELQKKQREMATSVDAKVTEEGPKVHSNQSGRKKRMSGEGNAQEQGHSHTQRNKKHQDSAKRLSRESPRPDEGSKAKKSDTDGCKPPSGRKQSIGKQSIGKRDKEKHKEGSKQEGKPKRESGGVGAAEEVGMRRIIESILHFLPDNQTRGTLEGKEENSTPRFAGIPVHNLSIPDRHESEGLKLPAIDPTLLTDTKSDRRPGEKKKTKKNTERDDKESSSLAVSGVQVAGSMDRILDDEISGTSTGSQDSAMQRTMSMHSGLVSDIWIPPPGNLNKKIFNTICIFPLHTSDQSTSTDDLNPGDEFTMAALEIAPPAPDNEQSLYSSTQGSPIVPRGVSRVESVSRPNTRDGKRGDTTIVISHPITASTVPPASSRAPYTDSPPIDDRATSAKEKMDNAPPVTLQDVSKELTRLGETEGNPLLQLYLCFYKDLDVQCRSHLLAAASGVSMDGAKYAAKQGVNVHKGSPYAVASLQGMSDMFEVVAEEVSKLEYTSYYAMQALFQVEQTINDLILIATSREELTDSFYFHLKESSKKLGEVKIAEAWVSMLLHDSRAIFTRTRALGIDPVLIGPQFSIAYKCFLSCQGSNLSLKKKLDEVHALLQKYLAVPVAHMQNTPEDGAKNHRLEQRCEQLQERCDDLEEAIDDIKDENEELRQELQRMDSQLDRTPGALLFFSVLQSPKLPEIVSSHIQTLQGVKSTIEGTDHFDFIALKRRLEKCLHGLPAMQQFFKKYTTLHKKWAVSRAKMFSDRRQIGADADNHYVCPICNIDSRAAEVDIGCPLVNTAPKHSNSTGGLATVTKMKTNQRSKNNGLTLTPSSRSPGASQFGF